MANQGKPEERQQHLNVVAVSNQANSKARIPISQLAGLNASSSLSPIQNFFDTTWNTFVQQYRWLIVTISLLLTLFAASRLLEIEGLASMEQHFGGEHPVEIAASKMANDFDRDNRGEPIMVELMWGIRGINKAEVDGFNVTDIGKVVWDEAFDLS